MALGTTIAVAGSPHKVFDCVVPMSFTSGWQTIIDAGGPAILDAATITDPTSEITNSTTHIFHRYASGTIMLLRLAYDDGLTAITDPVVKVFGRTGDSDVWQILKTEGGSLTGTLTTAATDVTDGTYLYTTPDVLASAWDCLGCQEFLVGIQTALAGTGTVNNSFIQAKVI